MGTDDKSILVGGSGKALGTMAAYIDLNPVRAGIVADPKDYRFSGYGEAMGGGKHAREGLPCTRYCAAGCGTSPTGWRWGRRPSWRRSSGVIGGISAQNASRGPVPCAMPTGASCTPCATCAAKPSAAADRRRDSSLRIPPAGPVCPAPAPPRRSAGVGIHAPSAWNRAWQRHHDAVRDLTLPLQQIPPQRTALPQQIVGILLVPSSPVPLLPASRFVYAFFCGAILNSMA